MKRTKTAFFALIVLLASWPAFAIDPIPVPSGVTTGQILDLPIKGITLDEAKKSQILFYPRDGVLCKPVADWSGNLSILFSAQKPGKYLLAVFPVNKDGGVDKVEAEIEVGGTIPPPNPPPPNPPPTPPPATQPLLTLITAGGTWCEACNAVKADTLPSLAKELGDQLQVIDYADPEAAKIYPESALVPRWVFLNSQGKQEKKIGYLTPDQVNAWIGKEGRR